MKPRDRKTSQKLSPRRRPRPAPPGAPGQAPARAAHTAGRRPRPDPGPEPTPDRRAGSAASLRRQHARGERPDGVPSGKRCDSRCQDTSVRWRGRVRVRPGRDPDRSSWAADAQLPGPPPCQSPHSAAPHSCPPRSRSSTCAPRVKNHTPFSGVASASPTPCTMASALAPTRPTSFADLVGCRPCIVSVQRQDVHDATQRDVVRKPLDQ